MFSSPNMLHSVLPSTAERLCFTFWMSSEPHHLSATSHRTSSRAKVSPSPYSTGPGYKAWELLASHRTRKVLGKAIFSREWEDSLRLSHRESEGVDGLISLHKQDVMKIENALGRDVMEAVRELCRNTVIRGGQPIVTNWLI